MIYLFIYDVLNNSISSSDLRADWSPWMLNLI